MFNFFKKSHELPQQHLYEVANKIGAKVERYSYQYVVTAPLGTRWTYNGYHEVAQPYKGTEAATINILINKINTGLLRCETPECAACFRLFNLMEEGDTVKLNLKRDMYNVAI